MTKGGGEELRIWDCGFKSKESGDRRQELGEIKHREGISDCGLKRGARRIVQSAKRE